MDWTQVITILGGNMALFLWATRQARADFLHLDKKIDADFLYLDKKLDENRKETQAIVKAIQDEIREFHKENLKRRT